MEYTESISNTEFLNNYYDELIKIRHELINNLNTLKLFKKIYDETENKDKEHTIFYIQTIESIYEDIEELKKQENDIIKKVEELKKQI